MSEFNCQDKCHLSQHTFLDAFECVNPVMTKRDLRSIATLGGSKVAVESLHHIEQKICDPVQQKVHLVQQVYSEIMNKTVCKI